ncbi:MAG: S-methyl-5-thioribose-1-phosphate isomerase [Planctomycetes bacterium]|nr:S-methyl-5-thioribose-1-phosphate isomerase [Planctomycetota bacterium]
MTAKKSFDAPTLEWSKGTVKLIEQTLLPEQEKVVTIRTPKEMWDAIKRLAVRGAPAIGCAAAYGVVLGIHKSKAKTPAALLKEAVKTADYLATSRPTAVNLFWALDRMKSVATLEAKTMDVPTLKQRILDEAHAILEEDKAMCHAIGRNGAKLVTKRNKPFGILTHCNAGGLATSEYGTALAVMYEAHSQKKNIHVYSDETRPLCQGSRLTTWELMRAGVPVTLICDNMAAQVMREGRIDIVVTGADRIAANGDSANKIGTYGVAILAKFHGIPFYIAAPSSTFDLSLKDGSQIPIEERHPEEIKNGFGKWTAPRKAKIYNPAFDVTPAGLIAGIITERGIIEKPNTAKVKKHLA